MHSHITSVDFNSHIHVLYVMAQYNAVKYKAVVECKKLDSYDHTWLYMETNEYWDKHSLCGIYKSYPKNISTVKKGKAKKVQVTERPKDVISL